MEIGQCQEAQGGENKDTVVYELQIDAEIDETRTNCSRKVREIESGSWQR